MPQDWSVRVALELNQSLNGLVVEVVEPLPATQGTTRAFLVRTGPNGKAPLSERSPNATPTYWLATVDDETGVAKYQYLAEAYKSGETPDKENLWSTFTLSFDSSTQAILKVSEPSPGNTAWGRFGFVRFTWPEFKMLEFEYRIVNFLNPAWTFTNHWNWDTQSGFSWHDRFNFNYVVPSPDVAPEFVASTWKTADISTCSSRLDELGSAHKSGKQEPVHIRTLLAGQNVLFVELETPKSSPQLKGSSISVCYGDVNRSEHEEPYAPAPSCFTFNVDGTHERSPLEFEKAPDLFRYKIVVPHDADAGDLGITVIFRNPQTKTFLSTSPYPPKTARRLGAVLDILQVRCDLVGNVLEPHFQQPAWDSPLF